MTELFSELKDKNLELKMPENFPLTVCTFSSKLFSKEFVLGI